MESTKIKFRYYGLVVIAIVLVFQFGNFAHAGPDDDAMMGRPTYEKNGQLFVVQFSPGNKRVDIKFAGDPMASVSKKDITVLGHVFSFSGESRDVSVDWVDNHFQIRDSLEPTAHLDLEIRDRKTFKSETFHFNGDHPKKKVDEKQ
jgi:hypothetical protein